MNHDTSSLLHSPLLSSLDGLIHGFSTRMGGVSGGSFSSLNLSDYCGDDPDKVQANRLIFCREAAVSLEECCLMKQLHGTEATVFERKNKHLIPEADIALTATPGLALIVQSADCLPILFVDPTVRAIAAVHAGWRGVAAGVAPKAVEALERIFGAKPRNLYAAIGPGIGLCCFEVGGEVAELCQPEPKAKDPLPSSLFFFERGLRPSREASGSRLRGAKPEQERKDLIPSAKWNIDLAGVVRFQLLRTGMREDRIDILPHCTFCDPALFFSHRRDRGVTGRHWSVIQLKG